MKTSLVHLRGKKSNLGPKAILGAFFLVLPAMASAGDSAAGDPKLAQAMEAVGRGTLSDAQGAVATLSEASRAHPDRPIYGKLRGEIEIFFRAEFNIARSQAALEEAKKVAEQKMRNRKMALEPSRLTGRNDPIAAERYRKQAEEILAGAKESETRVIQNFRLALRRMDDLAVEMLADGEEAVALGLGKSVHEVARRNAELLVAEDGTAFVPSLSADRLDEIKISVEVRQVWVRQGLEKEKAGEKDAALELFKKAGFEEGINRLGGN